MTTTVPRITSENAISASLRNIANLLFTHQLVVCTETADLMEETRKAILRELREKNNE